MSLHDFVVVIIVSVLFGVADRGYTEEQNDFSSTVECGRRHTRNTVSERIMNGTVAEPEAGSLGNIGLQLFWLGALPLQIHFVPGTRTPAFFLHVSEAQTRQGPQIALMKQTRPDAAEQSDTTQNDATQNAKVICVDMEQVCIPVPDDCNFFYERHCDIEI
uniref:Putative secreted protein n=1 Tax=Ixodes ricinus TaxID=34613 RepID=A0A090XD05_IXORI